jgi:predicted N-acetyltransferase YhbS
LEIDRISGRQLRREEIDQVWAIDRSEVIHHVYYCKSGTLVLKPEYYEVDGWPPGEAEKYTPLLIDCFARSGWFYGLFDDAKLIGAAILDGRFIGRKQDEVYSDV